MYKLALCLLATGLCISASELDFTKATAAIRGDDLATLRSLTNTPNAANASNGLKYTPLHYAAMYGSLGAMKLLLEEGAQVDARNQAGATPLVLAAWDFERTKLLVEHGASVNAATRDGMTPLLVAAPAQDNWRTVAYLLAHGADAKAIDADGEDALMRAAFAGDAETLKLLLAAGANAKRADKAGFTALQNAMTFPDSERVATLLKAGSNPNTFNTFGGMVKNGPLALKHITPLIFAAPYSDQKTISLLLAAGANVNDQDGRGVTPLIAAIATDHAEAATIRKLMDAGADLQMKDVNGQTALDWANKYRNPEIISMLVKAGAKAGEPEEQVKAAEDQEPGNASDAINRSIALFAKSNFFQAGGGCNGCHHQAAYARAYASAKSANLEPTPELKKGFVDAMTANRPRWAGPMQYLSTFGGDIDTVLYMLAGETDLKEPPSAFTDLTVHFLALRQDTSGAWFNCGIARSPLQESTISRTARAIVVLKQYGWPARQAEFTARVRRAEEWLKQSKPETPYEHADRILGLREAGVSASNLQGDAAALLALQRENGGWAQTQYLESDAYATGLVLDTLFKAGLVDAHDAAYQRGVKFLLKTQYPDGSWYVRSRAPKFQPYFQSGFPFNHDQWISSIGTSWAVMALSHAVVPDRVAQR